MHLNCLLENSSKLKNNCIPLGFARAELTAAVIYRNEGFFTQA